MEKINKKLGSTQGTSIFFGILFFMIASILSIVMLNGAVTAVKSVQSDRQAEQNFLTCSSAAKTLRDAITETKVTRVKTVITKMNNQEPPTIDWSAAKEDGTASDVGSIYLLSWLKNLVDNQMSGGTMTQTLNIQGPEPDTIKPVTVKVTVTEDSEPANSYPAPSGETYKGYDIMLEFTTGEGVDACEMNVKLSGGCGGSYNKVEDKYATGGIKQTTETTTTTYTWNAGRIIYGEDSETEAAAG